ncbi:MAG: FtsX-like permease family protein [Terriglobales bacterium]
MGIYGVASHAVSRRRHEIGVRMALGAGVPEIGRWVLAGSLLWTLAGAALGVVAGLTVTRVLSSLLYQTPTWDPLTMLAAPLLLAAVAAIATWGPARRAMQVDPAAMLRAE